MAASHVQATGAEDRSEPRDAVYHHARAIGPDGRALRLLIVNVSTHGLMARCDIDCPVGQALRIDLPDLGRVGARIRWSLGGRIGCQLDEAIPPKRYDAILAVLSRGM